MFTAAGMLEFCHVILVYQHGMTSFQVQTFNTSDLSDGILRDPGGGAVLGPIHEPPLHRHSRPQAGQLHAGTCGYQTNLPRFSFSRVRGFEINAADKAGPYYEQNKTNNLVQLITMPSSKSPYGGINVR